MNSTFSIPRANVSHSGKYHCTGLIWRSMRTSQSVAITVQGGSSVRVGRGLGGTAAWGPERCPRRNSCALRKRGGGTGALINIGQGAGGGAGVRGPQPQVAGGKAVCRWPRRSYPKDSSDAELPGGRRGSLSSWTCPRTESFPFLLSAHAVLIRSLLKAGHVPRFEALLDPVAVPSTRGGFRPPSLLSLRADRSPS